MCLAPLAPMALAEIIDFEDVNLGAATRDNFLNLGIENTYRGYTWSRGPSNFGGEGYWAAVANGDGQFVGAHGGNQSGWNWNGPRTLSVTFDVDKIYVGAWFNVFSGGQDWGADAVNVIGYDSSNSVTGQTGFVALDDVSASPGWVYAAGGFTARRIEILVRQDDTSWGPDGWWSVDDIELGVVPEPCTMIALGAGLVGFVARRRRK